MWRSSVCNELAQSQLHGSVLRVVLPVRSYVLVESSVFGAWSAAWQSCLCLDEHVAEAAKHSICTKQHWTESSVVRSSDGDSTQSALMSSHTTQPPSACRLVILLAVVFVSRLRDACLKTVARDCTLVNYYQLMLCIVTNEGQFFTSIRRRLKFYDSVTSRFDRLVNFTLLQKV